MYNTFFIHHINNTKYHLLWYRVSTEFTGSYTEFSMSSVFFCTNHDRIFFACLVWYNICCATISNINHYFDVTSTQWPKIIRLLSVSVEFGTEHTYSTLEVQRVQCICSLYLHVDEPCNFYGHTYHPCKWSSAHLYRKQTIVYNQTFLISEAIMTIGFGSHLISRHIFSKNSKLFKSSLIISVTGLILKPRSCLPSVAKLLYLKMNHGQWLSVFTFKWKYLGDKWRKPCTQVFCLF